MTSTRRRVELGSLGDKQLDRCCTLFDGAQLPYADLSYASLSNDGTGKGTKMTNANLRHANLSYADLTGVQLDGSDLTGADLTGVITHKTSWVGTICPDGHVWSKNSPCHD